MATKYTFAQCKDSYTKLWQGMQITKLPAADKQAKAIVANKDRYKAVEALTGVPWFVIGIIHTREAGSPPDFKATLHNGQKIIGTGKKTTIVPIGKGPFATFEDAAVDALASYKGAAWSPEYVAYTLEKYNGFGYRMRNLPSPYLWGGTNRQLPGKFISDGHFDPKVVDPQIGGMAVLYQIMGTTADANFGGTAIKAVALAEQPLSSSTINQGAVATGGLTIAGAASTAWDKVQESNETVLNAILAQLGKPYFWIALAAVAACGFIIWKRKALRDSLRGV